MPTSIRYSAPPTSGRDAAIRAIVRRLEQFPDVDLHAEDDDLLELPVRERRLAHALDQATARHWLTLIAVLQVHINRPWDQLDIGVRAPLLAGAAQLLYFDKIPPHAAINESVEWAKRNGRAKASGLVNAVLRRTSELRSELAESTSCPEPNELPRPDSSSWRLTKDVFHGDDIERVALATSHPRVVGERWARQFGPERALHLMRHDLVAAPTLLTGTLDDEIDGVKAHSSPETWVFEGDHESLEALLNTHPNLRVQDPTTALSVAATARLSPGVIIDACAGRGTKTGQLAEMHPEAQVIATDVDQRRRVTLRDSWGDHERITVVEPEELGDWSGKADLLVLDVPCSNSGVFARRVEARYRLNDKSISDLTELQRQILANTLALCAPDAHLLYATCSIDPDENDGIVDWILKWHPFKEVHRETILPEGLPGADASGYRDGGFHALLRRTP